MIEAMELAADFFIGETAPVHLQEVASSRQGLLDSGEVGASGAGGDGKVGQVVRVCGILPGQVKFALRVLLGDLEIAQSHADVFVPEQLHDGRQADAQTEHLRYRPTHHEGCETRDQCCHNGATESLRSGLIALGKPERVAPEYERRCDESQNRPERSVRCAFCRAGHVGPTDLVRAGAGSQEAAQCIHRYVYQ